MNAAHDSVLCVDLDGTLIRTDLLLESLLLLVKRNPLLVFLLPLWLLRGKAHLKEQIARRVEIDAAVLPYNKELLAWLTVRKQEGACLWLCTASHDSSAQKVAAHLGIFDGVLATTAAVNLAGARKAAILVERFGEQGFEYCGNASPDMAIWKRAKGAIVVNATGSLSRRAQNSCKVVRTFPSGGAGIRATIRALRPHQWAKNALIFLPVLAAHRITDASALATALLAMVIFNLCASAVYLLNDMLDLNADRQHPRKSKRPFAAGDISLLVGFVLTPLLLIAAALLSWFLPAAFAVILAGYFFLTLMYSFRLKSMVLVDTLSLAALYTVRILAGAAATAIPLSFWMLLFSVFLFLSLAMVKRYTELRVMRGQNKLVAAGRGYHVEDLSILQSLGTAAGYISVLVLALYINSPAVEPLYHRPQFLWLLCALVLYWIGRMWMIAHRGDMHDDPVMFALKDGMSIFVAAVAAATLMIAV